jgi:hypothetical protein
MFRRGGDLLSTANPNSDSLKFQRMNPNPCTVQSCNLLASCCEATCTTYLANSYFITQLTDDIPSVIYDLGLIRPVNDPKNKSNFLFLAVHWAQMLLFETWTDHPNADATNQKFAHPARSSKKKAIIFVVNSPDRFEPNELTYLGFNNDYSEVNKIASDTLNFGTDFGTGAKQSSPNKLLTFTTTAGSVTRRNGYYECTDANVVTGKLTFPNKYLVKLTVAQGSVTATPPAEWVKVGTNTARDARSRGDLNSVTIGTSTINLYGLRAIGNTVYAIDKWSGQYGVNNNSGQLVCLDTVATTKTWTKISSNAASDIFSNETWYSLCAIGNKIYTIGKPTLNMGTPSGKLACLDTVATTKTWTKIDSNTADDISSTSSKYWRSLCAIENKIYVIEDNSGQLVCLDTVATTKTWTKIGSNTADDASSGSWYSLCAIGNKLYTIDCGSGQLVYLDTAATTKTWTKIGSNTADNASSGNWNDLCAIGNKIYTIADSSGQLVYLDTVATTKTWTKIGSNTANDASSGNWCGLCAIGDKIYAMDSSSGQLVCLDTALALAPPLQL